MASIEKLQTEIKQLETDVTALVNAHSTCPTTEQVQAAVVSVQALSSQAKAAIAKDEVKVNANVSTVEAVQN